MNKSILVRHEIPTSACPGCGAVLDLASGLEGGALAAAGDLGLCFQCGHLLIFNADLSARELTPAEIDALPAGVLADIGFVENFRQQATETPA